MPICGVRTADLSLNVQEVRLGSNPCPSLHMDIFDRKLGENTLCAKEWLDWGSRDEKEGQI